MRSSQPQSWFVQVRTVPGSLFAMPCAYPCGRPENAMAARNAERRRQSPHDYRRLVLAILVIPRQYPQSQ